ncbi:MAG: hypothetical protein JJ920_00680 [Roseitalea sp.]|jgi:hypothetical protein|nr:hypothetical protein [Roseitalea sp.]MBO6741393.1 hypothetical protein [Roseitalea sp.]
MQAVSTIGTALVVALLVVGGAYVGTFWDNLVGDDSAPAPVLPLTRTVELPPVSVPVYQDRARVGYCVLTASVDLSNGYSDEEFQMAITSVADAMLRKLSVVAAGEDVSALCAAQTDKTLGAYTIVKSEYFQTVRAVPRRT